MHHLGYAQPVMELVLLVAQECKFALRGGICVSSCEDGEYISAKRCLLCHEECVGCTGGTELDCIACRNVKNFLDDGRI